MELIKVVFNDYVAFFNMLSPIKVTSRVRLSCHCLSLRNHIFATCWWLLDTFSINGCRLSSFIDWLEFIQTIGRQGHHHHVVWCCSLIWGSAALRGLRSRRCLCMCTTGGCSSRSLSCPERRGGIGRAAVQIWCLAGCWMPPSCLNRC